MSIAATLAETIIAGSHLFGEAAAKELGKKFTSTAFDKIMAKLKQKLTPISVAILETPGDKTPHRAALESDLGKPEIIEDLEMLELTERLSEDIITRQADLPPAYAVDVETIRATKGVVFKQVEGVKAKLIETQGFARFTDIKAPK